MPRALRDLEARAIHLLRELVAEFARPVLLYSGGKDSSVLIHLATKAFAPGPFPLPLLHVATGWDFRELLDFRDQTAARLGVRLVVHTNSEGQRRSVLPWHGARYGELMLTGALREALDAGGYDLAIGGARRDEERSRAKERVLSLRQPGHRWDPRRQRPEFWSHVNGRLLRGQTARAFPISDWTERDVWEYIALERVPLVSLYFARSRPVVERDGALIAVDDERLPLAPGERPRALRVRFRTLGCYPLTAAVPSDADTAEAILRELSQERRSERAGRLVDGNDAGSMERKKRAGYF